MDSYEQEASISGDESVRTPLSRVSDRAVISVVNKRHFPYVFRMENSWNYGNNEALQGSWERVLEPKAEQKALVTNAISREEQNVLGANRSKTIHSTQTGQKRKQECSQNNDANSAVKAGDEYLIEYVLTQIAERLPVNWHDLASKIGWSVQDTVRRWSEVKEEFTPFIGDAVISPFQTNQAGNKFISTYMKNRCSAGGATQQTSLLTSTSDVDVCIDLCVSFARVLFTHRSDRQYTKIRNASLNDKTVWNRHLSGKPQVVYECLRASPSAQKMSTVGSDCIVSLQFIVTAVEVTVVVDDIMAEPTVAVHTINTANTINTTYNILPNIMLSPPLPTLSREEVFARTKAYMRYIKCNKTSVDWTYLSDRLSLPIGETKLYWYHLLRNMVVKAIVSAQKRCSTGSTTRSKSATAVTDTSTDTTTTAAVGDTDHFSATVRASVGARTTLPVATGVRNKHNAPPLSQLVHAARQPPPPPPTTEQGYIQDWGVSVVPTITSSSHSTDDIIRAYMCNIDSTCRPNWNYLATVVGMSANQVKQRWWAMHNDTIHGMNNLVSSATADANLCSSVVSTPAIEAMLSGRSVFTKEPTTTL